MQEYQGQLWLNCSGNTQIPFHFETIGIYGIAIVLSG